MLTKRSLSVCGLAVGLTMACGDSAEPPTHLPDNGAWDYTDADAVTNTCSAEATAIFDMVMFMQYYVDYDEGSSFQVEMGQDDLVCVIEGESFTCSDVEIYSDEQVRVALTWEGELSSPRAMSGEEVWKVICQPEQDCSSAFVQPCERRTMFSGEFAE